MNITIIGSGYVGLVTGACLSEFGHRVTCMDVDKQKIENLNNGILPIYEPGLESVVEKNARQKRLFFTTDYKDAIENSTVIFIAVGTPPLEDGSADMQYVVSAAKSIAENMNSYKIVVNKSTVPIGTGRKTKETIKHVLKSRDADFGFDVVSNPEFLREGSAVNDFMHPDRIVIGCESQTAKDIMSEIYRVLYINNHPFCVTDIETAELIKYAANAFLATKITFINEISVLCEAVGANVQQISAAMGLDKRIGKFFLHAGPGYGGSCFPKDTKALVKIAQAYDVKMTVVDSVIKANEAQKLHMVDKIVSKMPDIQGKTIAILGLAFKPETDDMREAPSITIINELLRRNARIKAYDPISMENSKRYGLIDDNIEYCRNEYEAVRNSDAIVILTEWNQFRSLDFDKIKEISDAKYFFDLRNIYDRNMVESKGFVYDGVGM